MSTTTDRIVTATRRGVDGLAIAVIVVALGTVVLARLVPALGHPVFVVAGPSMTPAVDIGAAVVLETVAPATLAVGDVVSLKSGPQRAVFTHRIVRVVERADGVWIETKGDANPAADPSLTSADAVIGRVTLSIPLAGYLIALLSIPSGVVFTIALGCALLVLAWSLEGVELERRRRLRTDGRSPRQVVVDLEPAIADVTVATPIPPDLTRSEKAAAHRRRRTATLTTTPTSSRRS